MARIFVPAAATEQPLHEALVNPDHWLAKDITLALNGATPWFNSALGGTSSALTSGGSGYSIRPTTGGRALWTPNGGWANFALKQDWYGPNTLICLCRLNDIDNPWGSLFSKESTGTDTQFNIGRWSSEDWFTGGMITSGTKFTTVPVDANRNAFHVFAWTHPGGANGYEFYIDGSLAGTCSALPAQAAGTGDLGLGRPRDLSASFDSDIDWVGVVRVRRVMAAPEIVEVSRNIWGIWEGQSIDVWIPEASAPSSFQAAWARNSNSIITGAVR